MQGNPKEYYTRELEALYEIAKMLSSGRMQTEIFREILYILEKRLWMYRGTIMLLTLNGAELVVEALGAEYSPEQMKTTYRKGEGITGKVLETGNPEIIPRISKEPRFQNRIYKRKDSGDFSFICIPVILENQTVGTISCDIVYEPDNDLSDVVRFLSIVASMISYDIQNRRSLRAQKEELESENKRLLGELTEAFHPENIIGNSHEMRMVYKRICQVAQSDTTVLIQGESGTGKELVASAIHYNSQRLGKPFIKVNCAALSENLLESELFGHEKGAFTGAYQRRTGRIEEAEGGTLFLDEIGEFSPVIQVKLLRVIQEREYESVGSNKTRKANVRIITATNRDLEAAVRAGTFRQDLYYRINVFPIYLPPLRNRKSDIILLANYFIEKYSRKMNKLVNRISTSAINMLLAYHWPGNVRELENCLEHAVLLSSDNVVHAHDLPPTLQMPDLKDRQEGTYNLKSRTAVFERDLIIDVLKEHNGNINAASKELGITGRMVRYKIQNLGIDIKSITRK